MLSPAIQQEALNRIKNVLAGAKPWTLIVDDDENDAFLAQSLLHSQGMKSTWVKTAVEAVKLIKSCDYKIVFLDLDLKDGGDPKDVLSACRETGRCLIIILTGVYSPDSDYCKDALRLGATAVMMKPLTYEQVNLIYGTP